MVLDNKRPSLARAQDEGLKKLEGDLFKGKKNEFNSSTNEVFELKNQLEEAHAMLSRKNTELDGVNKKLVNYEASRKRDLEDANHRGYDLCFNGKFAEVTRIQGKLFQVGYDMGLDEALIPSTNSLRVPVSIHASFKYNDEVEAEVEEAVEGDASKGDKAAEDGNDGVNNAAGATT